MKYLIGLILLMLTCGSHAQTFYLEMRELPSHATSQAVTLAWVRIEISDTNAARVVKQELEADGMYFKNVPHESGIHICHHLSDPGRPCEMQSLGTSEDGKDATASSRAFIVTVEETVADGRKNPSFVRLPADGDVAADSLIRRIGERFFADKDYTSVKIRP